MNEARHDDAKHAPFDTTRLDILLENEGIDILVATSKHNVQYLLGGYRFFFFDYMDAIGVSRYLPVVVYQKGRPDNSAYIGCHLESHEKQLGEFWPRVAKTTSRNSTDAIRRAVEHSSGPATRAKDDRRACTAAGSLRTCSGFDVAVFKQCAPGQTKHEFVDRLRREEVGRGLTFEYCLISVGKSFDRAPSDQRLEFGDIFSLDSGGNYRGYIGDLCRMGILGEPDAELVDLLGVIEEIQQRARRAIRRGAAGAEIFAAAHELVDASPHRLYLDFVAHGMSLVSHEAPRLTDYKPWAYDGYDATLPLETDMVLSIETTMAHPKRGFIKLEDTVAVTEKGCVGFGDQGRGWNRAG